MRSPHTSTRTRRSCASRFAASSKRLSRAHWSERRTQASAVEQIAPANEEAIRAWDGPLFDRFVRFRHLLTTGLGVQGEEAVRRVPPRAGERVLDIGCGFGDTSQRI